MQPISVSSISGSSTPAQIAARQEQVLAVLNAEREASAESVEISSAVEQVEKGDGPPPPPPGGGPPPGPPPGGGSSSESEADMESLVLSLFESAEDTETETDTSTSAQISDAIAQYAQSLSATEAA